MSFSKHRLTWYVSRAGIIVLIMAVSAGITLYVWFHRDIQKAEARIAQGSQIAETACGRIEYSDSGTGIPVLSIHGSGGGYDQGAVIGELLGDGFRIIAPSRFGYLNSPYPANHSVVDQAHAYTCLLDTLGLDKVSVIAFSAGGTSALQFAQLYPDRVASLTMVSAVSNVRPVREANESAQSALLTNFVFWAASTLATDPTLQFFGVSAETQAAMTEVEMDRARAILRLMNPLSLRKTGLDHDSTEANLFDGAVFDLESITAPTLVVHAEDDTFIPIAHGEYTAAHIPGARLVRFEHGGHFVAVLDSAITEIAAFIQQHYSPNIS
jgi:pimeloyl-ACP methyl ester carboxylesterase